MVVFSKYLRCWYVCEFVTWEEKGQINPKYIMIMMAQYTIPAFGAYRTYSHDMMTWAAQLMQQQDFLSNGTQTLRLKKSLMQWSLHFRKARSKKDRSEMKMTSSLKEMKIRSACNMQQSQQKSIILLNATLHWLSLSRWRECLLWLLLIHKFR